MAAECTMNLRGNPQAHIALFSCLAALVTVFVSVSGSSLSAFGLPLPVLCPFRLLTTIDCPGCGLTRALVFAAQGNYAASYNMHIWGIPLWFLLIIQVPYRLGLAFSQKESLFTISPAVRRWFCHFVLLSFLLPWLAKTVALLVLRYC